MKLLVKIDGQTFERKVEKPKDGPGMARVIAISGLETEGEDGGLVIYPHHRIQLVELVVEADDPKPKAKKAK